MSQPMDELQLLAVLQNTDGLRMAFGAISVWGFTASFLPDDNWVARMEYTMNDDPESIMYGSIMEGRKDRVHTTRTMRPRMTVNRPPAPILTIMQVHMEGPGMDERIV